MTITQDDLSKLEQKLQVKFAQDPDDDELYFLRSRADRGDESAIFHSELFRIV